jgi:peptidoglycan/xylan/chitin deacetylase (PgdA/CDA1 family)
LKRIIVIGISLAIFVSDSLRRVIYSLSGKRMPPTVVVLAYHSIPKEKRAAFAKQMDELVRCSKPQRADMPLFSANGTRYACVTFDDGYQNIVDNAVPELVQRGIPATLFVVSGALGRVPSWEDHSSTSDPDMNEPIVTADVLRKLPSDLIQIGSHTVTHPMLPQLAEQQARAQLSASRRMLEEIIGREVNLFSFPYGFANANLVALCREAGYQHVFITHPTAALAKPDGLVVHRIKADPDDWPLEFRLKLYGTYRWRNMWRNA